MDTKLLLEYSIFADLIITVGVLVLMVRRRLLRDFHFLAAFLFVNCSRRWHLHSDSLFPQIPRNLEGQCVRGLLLLALGTLLP